MQVPANCWAGCGEDVIFEAPVTRFSDDVTDGVPVRCPECGHKYTLTADGDGEVDLEDQSGLMGQNIEGHGSDEVSHG